MRNSLHREYVDDVVLSASLVNLQGTPACDVALGTARLRSIGLHRGKPLHEVHQLAAIRDARDRGFMAVGRAARHGLLWDYGSAPGRKYHEPTQWPASSALPRHSGAYTLLMFIHPFYGCELWKRDMTMKLSWWKAAEE